MSRRKAEVVVESSDTIPEQIIFVSLVANDFTTEEARNRAKRAAEYEELKKGYLCLYEEVSYGPELKDHLEAAIEEENAPKTLLRELSAEIDFPLYMFARTLVIREALFDVGKTTVDWETLSSATFDDPVEREDPKITERIHCPKKHRG